MSFTLPSSDFLYRGHPTEVQSQNEELIENMHLYEDASLQQRLKTFPRQYYSIAYTVEDSETDLAAEVVEDDEVTVDNMAEDVVNHVFTNLQMEEEAACIRFVDEFVTSLIHNAVISVDAEEEVILDKARNIITDIIEKSYDILISITINKAMSDICRHAKDSSDPKTAQTENPSGKQQDSDCIQQSMRNPLSLATAPAASEPVLVGHHESVDELSTSTTHVADFDLPDSVLSEAGQGRTLTLGQPGASEMLQRQMNKAPHPRRLSAGDVAGIAIRTSSRPSRRRRRPRRAGGPESVLGLNIRKSDLDQVEDSESDLTAEVVEDDGVTVDNMAEDVVNHVLTNLQMEEEAACIRFVDDFVTSVIHNAVISVDAEEEVILDKARNIITDIIEKSYDILISITANRAMSDISCRHAKDSSDPKTAQTENPSGKQQDSDCIQQSMRNPLSLATAPAASEPVLVEHHESVDKLSTSTTHVADFDLPDSVLSEAGQGRTLTLGQPGASEMLQRQMDQAPHPRRLSAGDVAGIAIQTLSSPSRRRRRPRQAREDAGGPESVLGLNIRKSELDQGSTRHKPRTDPMPKDPGDADRTPTNPTNGLGLGSTQIHHKPRAGIPYESLPPTGSINKTHHKEPRSDPSYIDAREITPAERPKGLKIGGTSKEEVDPAHRPMKRTRIQRLLRGISRSLTRMGCPFVACFS